MLPRAGTSQGEKPWDRCLIAILMKGDGKGLFVLCVFLSGKKKKKKRNVTSEGKKQHS